MSGAGREEEPKLAGFELYKLLGEEEALGDNDDVATTWQPHRL